MKIIWVKIEGSKYALNAAHIVRVDFLDGGDSWVVLNEIDSAGKSKMLYLDEEQTNEFNKQLMSFIERN